METSVEKCVQWFGGVLVMSKPFRKIPFLKTGLLGATVIKCILCYSSEGNQFSTRRDYH